MKKANELIWITLIVALGFGANAMAESPKFRGANGVSFLHNSATAHQRAVFASFLAWVPEELQDHGVADHEDDFGFFNVDSAISVSNILAAPPGSLTDSFFGESVRGDRCGPVSLFLWDQDREDRMFYSTNSLNSHIGTGLNEDGTLCPGDTWTVRLAEILAEITGEDERTLRFVGYGWVVADFDGVAGTYSLTIFGFGFTQSFELLPGMGQGVLLGGIPVFALIPAGLR